MLRFFKEKTAFNTKSTATKILYEIKDHFGKYDSTSGHLINTDQIENMDKLVKTLAEVISSTLEYSIYQRCHSYVKKRIKSLVVEELVKVSKQYESKYTVMPVYGRKGDEKMEKGAGVTMSVRYQPGNGYPYQAYNIPEAICAHFPEELFLDKVRLQKHIIAALELEYLKIINPVSYQRLQEKSSNPTKETVTNIKSSPLLYPKVESTKEIPGQLSTIPRLYPDLEGYDLKPESLRKSFH